MKNNDIHLQSQTLTLHFNSLKNSVDYFKKVTGSSGTGPCLRQIIDPGTQDEQYTVKDLFIPEHLMKKDLPSITHIVHWHQPLGNVAKGIYKGVKDLMDILYEYYLMQLEVWESFILHNPHTGYIETVHLTGTLIMWMAQEHPEWLQRFARLVRGRVTGNSCEKPHFELFVSPYFESLASTLPMEEAVRQTRISIDVMNFFGMKPSGYWLVERIWEPGYFAIFTKELRKLGINKAAIDDHLFYKMSEREIKASGFSCTSFCEKDLRGYFILNDELKEKDPFYILPANRDYRQARPYRLSEIPRKGGKFSPYWIVGYLKGTVSKEKVIKLFNNNTYIIEDFFIKHPSLSFNDKSLVYLIFKDDFITCMRKADSIDEKSKLYLLKLWQETQKEKFSYNEALIWAGDGEKPANLWRYMGDKNQHKEDLEFARQWLYEELEAKINNHFAQYLPTDQLIEKSRCCGYITLPFGAYKEMTLWAHSTANQVRLNELIAKVETLKTTLHPQNSPEDKQSVQPFNSQTLENNPDDKMISDDELLLYEKLSNTEIKKYAILLNALKKRDQLALRREIFPGIFLTEKEEEELKNLEKGIAWKNFWLKYSESYKYHRLWLFLYKLTTKQVDNEELKELILNLLGRATVNCGSWHGVFGGRYLANLRHDIMWGIAAAISVYLYALEDKNLFTKGNALLYRFDFMGELADELREADINIKDVKKKKIPDIIIMTCRMMVVISLKKGGTLFDWIYFDTGNPQSVINTINLIAEPYHDDAKKMVSRFKRKCDLFNRFISIVNNYPDHEHPALQTINTDTITYNEFQDKVTSLQSVYDTIVKKDPAHIEIISLYRELIKKPAFSGTKTKMKPPQNLNVEEAVKNYDRRLPVNQIVRLYDKNTGKEIGSFDKADFELDGMNDKDEWYEVIIKAENELITLKKHIMIHKMDSHISYIYEITTTRKEQNIEVKIENNTNMSCLMEKMTWFEINGNIKTISGITEISDVHSLKIVNREDNMVQIIRIEPEPNRLIIRPRYSVSQGLRLFEMTLQYIRYSFIVPLCIDRDSPGRIMISHTLDSLARADEEAEWFNAHFAMGLGG